MDIQINKNFPSREQVEAAMSRSSYGNDVLYRMCEEKPLHDERDIISSKIWLIGRSYAVAIERNRSGKTQEEIYDGISEPVKWTKIAERIGRLRDKSVFSSIDILAEALALHYELTKLFSCITGLKKRSLASKYLHFHCPNAFYIYDSEVSAEINQIIKKPWLKLDGEFDEEYKGYAVKAFCLAQEANERYGIELSPRHLDTLLQEIHHSGNFVQ